MKELIFPWWQNGGQKGFDLLNTGKVSLVDFSPITHRLGG